MKNKKQRGQGRRLNNLLLELDNIKPFQKQTVDFEHFRMPCSKSFIESNKLSKKVKTQIIKKLVNMIEVFISNKPKRIDFCKVVLLIDEYYLYSSQIIIFYNKIYYDMFWKRDDAHQKWIKQDSQNSYLLSRGIETTLNETCYLEYSENSIITKLRFYGDVK